MLVSKCDSCKVYNKERDLLLLSVGTFLAELFTCVCTVYYLAVQVVTLATPEGGLNGFCLANHCTHSECACYDMIFVICMTVLVSKEDDLRPTKASVRLLVVLMAHAFGHLYLGYMTRTMTLDEANRWMHWSFTWVLVVVNSAYCLPRLVQYGPRDIEHRVGGGAVSASVGIMTLMCLSLLELLCCPSMARLGGHIVYDICISAVTLWHFVESRQGGQYLMKINSQEGSDSNAPTEIFLLHQCEC